MEMLFDPFEPAPKEEWIQQIEKELKGKPLDSLTWKAAPHINLDPFYTRQDILENAEGLAASFPREGWEIGEDIALQDLPTTKFNIQESLEGGVNALGIEWQENTSPETIKSLLGDVFLEMISIHCIMKDKGNLDLAIQWMETLKQSVDDKKLDGSQITGSINFLPGDSDDPEITGSLIQKGIKSFPNLKLIEFCDSASETEQPDPVIRLSTPIQEAINLIEKITNTNKITPQQIIPFIQFKLHVGCNYFLEIARLRAFQVLWGNVQKAYGIANPHPAYLNVYFTSDSQTADQHQNMIRATTQAMSAVIGGAHRLTIYPADAHQGNSSGHTKRIARNVQNILKLESYFDKVADPSAGSYTVEKLTEILVNKTWEKLR